MRGGRLTGGVVLACAGAATLAASCAASRPEPLERPRADGLTAAEEARRNRIELALERMSAYRDDLDPRQPAISTPALLHEALPPVPPVLPPVRPRPRVDALELADLALYRGDPLDAAAQYRAWISGRDLATTGYAHVQLARAYVALGQTDRAAAAFAAASRAPDTEWYALVQLAELRLPTFGPVAVAEQLTRMIPSRVDDIENYLIARASSEEMATLLMRKVERIPRHAAVCAYALAAVHRGVHRVPLGVDDTCRIEVDRAIHIALGEPWLDERNLARRLLWAERLRWATASSPAVAVPETWLAVAERYRYAMEVATEPADRELASRSAATALVNVARLANLGVRVSDEELARFDAVAADLAADDRRRVTGRRGALTQPGAR
jgi:tetratricopeptide (TPR) repeat protein